MAHRSGMSPRLGLMRLLVQSSAICGGLRLCLRLCTARSHIGCCLESPGNCPNRQHVRSCTPLPGHMYSLQTGRQILAWQAWMNGIGESCCMRRKQGYSRTSTGATPGQPTWMSTAAVAKAVTWRACTATSPWARAAAVCLAGSTTTCTAARHTQHLLADTDSCKSLFRVRLQHSRAGCP